MRVLLFTNSVAMGGMEEHVRLIAELLDRDRFEVFAVCPDRPEEFAAAMRGAADHVEVVTPDRRHGTLAAAREALRLLALLRRWRVDVAHFHSTTYTGEAVAMLCARLAGVRHVYVTEHLAPAGPLPGTTRRLRDLVMRLASATVCVSEKNLVARTAQLRTPPDRAVVVANGVDLRRCTPAPPDVIDALAAELQLGTAPVVGTAVRFEPEKGLDDLIDAFTIVLRTHPTAVLLLVGDGSLRRHLEQRVAVAGLDGSVRFVGFQPDPRPYLQLMDVFVLPVPVGSMSIGLLAAMALRRTVVITFGGEGEAVVHGESGRWARPNDPASIAEHVVELLDAPEERRRLGEAARQRVERDFSADRVAATLGRLYEEGPRAISVAARR